MIQNSLLHSVTVKFCGPLCTDILTKDSHKDSNDKLETAVSDKHLREDMPNYRGRMQQTTEITFLENVTIFNIELWDT